MTCHVHVANHSLAGKNSHCTCLYLNGVRVSCTYIYMSVYVGVCSDKITLFSCFKERMRLLQQMWQFAPNSVHYLLSLWQRMVASVPYVKATEPHMLETYTPEVTKAYITSRLDSVALVLR